MNFHDLNEGTKRMLDVVAYVCAGVAAISLAQAALVVTILAGLASLALAMIRIHDRIKYGRAGE